MHHFQSLYLASADSKSMQFLKELLVQVGHNCRYRRVHHCTFPLLIEVPIVAEVGGPQAYLKQLCNPVRDGVVSSFSVLFSHG